MINIASETEWHHHRAQHVGGSEIASLFEPELAKYDEKPFLSHYKLWHIKAGNVEPDNLDEEEFIQAGRYLEPAVLAWAADKTGWRMDKCQQYASNGKGLGGTPDALAEHPEQGRGVIELKTVDKDVFRKWGGQPPVKYQLQLQSYLGLTGLAWGAIIVLAGGNHLEVFEVTPFKERVFDAQTKRVVNFWGSIASDTPPDVNSIADYPLYLSMLPDVTGDSVDWQDNEAAAQMLQEYTAWKQQAAIAEENTKRLQKQFADALVSANARKAYCVGGTISRVDVAEKPGQRITPDMVGREIGARKAYTKILVTPKKDKTDV